MASTRRRGGRRGGTDPARADALVASGMVELAAGALSGWVYTLARTQPELAGRLGIQSAARIRQWHLDLAMLGTATIAAGLAEPDAPRLPATALGIGAWTNAMAFLPLAFRPGLDQHPAFRAYAGTSFVLTTTGFVGMAAGAVRRARSGRRAGFATPAVGNWAGNYVGGGRKGAAKRRSRR